MSHRDHPERDVVRRVWGWIVCADGRIDGVYGVHERPGQRGLDERGVHGGHGHVVEHVPVCMQLWVRVQQRDGAVRGVRPGAVRVGAGKTCYPFLRVSESFETVLHRRKTRAASAAPARTRAAQRSRCARAARRARTPRPPGRSRAKTARTLRRLPGRACTCSRARAPRTTCQSIAPGAPWGRP